MSAGCDQNRGSALNKRLRPLIPKPPGNKLLDGQSHFGLTADAASEACIVRRRNLISEDVEMPTPTYFCTSSQKLQTQKSDLLRLNSGREAGTCRVLSLSSRWNPTTDQLKMLEDLYKRGIRTPSAEQIQYITAQLRRYGKIEGKNVFYWFQNHKARERQKRRRRMEMLQLEAVPAIHLDTVKPSEVAAGSTDSNWMISSSPLATSSFLAKEPESLKSFLKLAMPSAEEDEEGEHRRTTLLSRRYNSAPVRPSYIITQKYFQQRHNSGSVNAGDSELIYDGPQSSKGVNQDDGGGFLDANPIATERCSTLRIDGLQTLELFPLRSCSSTAEEDISLVLPAGSESSLVSCQMEPNSSASLSCSSCTDEKRNSTSPQHNRGFGSIKHDGDTIGSRTDDEDEQLIYVKRDAQEKRQQLPCRFFQFLPLRM